MCAVPFLGKLPPYRFFVSCAGSAADGIQLQLRIETRVLLQLPHALRARLHVVSMAEAVVHLHLELEGPSLLAEGGQSGNAPAAVVYQQQLPPGVDRCRCTLRLGQQRQSFVLLLEPPRVYGYAEDGAEMPLAELILL